MAGLAHTALAGFDMYLLPSFACAGTVPPSSCRRQRHCRCMPAKTHGGVQLLEEPNQARTESSAGRLCSSPRNQLRAPRPQGRNLRAQILNLKFVRLAALHACRRSTPAGAVSSA
jgi:hypothetical protein